MHQGLAIDRSNIEDHCLMALSQCLKQLEIRTPGAGFTRLDQQLNDLIAESGIHQGVLHLTCLHTSASLTINENADPRVLEDLQA